MITLAWKRRLDTATSADEVMEITRHFVATFSVADIDRLPAYSRPGELAGPADVANYAARLQHHYFDGDAATARVLTRLVEFFSAAAIRLAEVARAPVARDDA